MPSEAPHGTYDVAGRRCRVRDTLRDYLLAVELLQDDGVTGSDRFALLVAMLFPDPERAARAFGPKLRDAVSDALWEAFGIDLDDERVVDGQRAIDWAEDRDRAVVTARAAYRLSWDEMLALPYREACLLMSMAPHDTPMGQAVYYRLAEEPRRTKHNAEQVEAFRKMRNHYRLKG